MPWRVMGACVPPVSKCGGWPAFVGAFFAIGSLTYILVEISSVLSCITGFSTCLQSLLCIALVLAIPDTVSAYKSATSTESKYADASIGTVAGSNAVAIFVGLGLPWVNATIYHWAKYGQSFYIGKQSTVEITFALITFLGCSSVVYIILFFRRLFVGGELGGSKVVRYISGCVMFFLWGFFVFMNVLHCTGIIVVDLNTANLPDTASQVQLTCAD
jgi:solute carrier family 8 (sodium/calcium exchanger)